MSNLYLSSYRIPTLATLCSMLEDSPENTDVGVIVNAKDYKDPSQRLQKLDLLRSDLTELGFIKQTQIDLRDYADSDELDSDMERYDMLYVAGGSTPALRIAMERSGFDYSLTKFLARGGVYVGESAGAYVAGPYIKVHEEDDRHIGLPYFPGQGLSLVPVVIIPHADNPDYLHATERMSEYYQKMGVQSISLNDNQAYVVSNGTVTIETGDNSRYDNRLRS